MAASAASTGETDGGGPRGSVIAVVYLILFALALVPVFSFAVPPLGDVLNHLARAYIINNLEADPVLQQYYAVDWKLFSFQSTDLLLPLFGRSFGLEVGAQLFVAFSFALLLAGTAAVHRALFGRIGVWPAAAVLFLYNFPLAAGQISFLFSSGLSLLLFAAWIASETSPRALRLPAFIAASFGLLLCHFFAFCAYALLLMTFELGRVRRLPSLGAKLRRMVEAGLPFVVPTICFLLAFGKTIAGATFYGDPLGKALAFLAATTTYGFWPDITLTVVIGLALWWLDRRNKIVFAPDMRLPVAVLIVTAVAMPRLLQGVHGADLRLPCLLAFLLVAASDVRLGRRQIALFLAGVVALMVLRVATVTAQWGHFDADYREFRAVDDKLPRGSRVMVIPVRTMDLRADPQPTLPYWYIAAYAVIDRQVFLPMLYTFATPLGFAGAGTELGSDTLAKEREMRWRPADPAFASVDSETIHQVEQAAEQMADDDVYTSTIDWSDWPERFDYAVDFHLGRSGNPVPALLAEVWRGSYFTIYRIHPPQQR